MIITVTVKLEPDGQQKADLLTLMNKTNRACNWLSEIAFKDKLFNWYKLQQRTYRELMNNFNLPSALVVASIRKVAATYKNKKRRNKQATFNSLSIPLYKHSYKKDGTLRFYGLRIAFKAKECMWLSSKNQAFLKCRSGKFIVYQCLEQQEQLMTKPNDHLGVDMGIANIAVDSDGCFHFSRHVNNIRIRNSKLRAKLQRKGTKSAKRLLKKRSGKEAMFVRNTNHVISKSIVSKAKDTGRGIAIEDLKGIRSRITVRKAQRYRHHSWSFGQLRMFIEYKAKLQGVDVIVVNPKNTSRTCPKCGNIDKRNRKMQSKFICKQCGYAAHADFIGAVNIRSAAARNQPYAAGLTA